MNKLLSSLLVGSLLLFGAAPSAQAAFPEKPVTVVVGFAPGGTGDLTVRMLAKPLEKILGQPVVIVNKGGGAGMPGFEYVLKSKPDGYTISAPGVGACISSAMFLRGKTYNFDDMTLVGGYMILDRILLARTDKPYKTWQEFIDYVKANPGKVSVGSGASQEATEVLRSFALKNGLDMNFIMYKSGGEASADLIGGHIDACELGVGTAAYQAARKGELNVLLNLGLNEIPDIPNVPKLHTDLGHPFYASLSYGFVLPKGTPEDIRAIWENALKQALADPQVQENMLKAGFTPKFITPAEYRPMLDEATQNLVKLVDYINAAKK